MSSRATEGVYRDHDCDADGHTTDGGRVSGVTRWTYVECADYGCPARVVLDPEDREQVGRVIKAVKRESYATQSTDAMQAALRSLVTDPKPEEPQGRYAVVEDRRGREWVRAELVGLTQWKCLTLDQWANYADIDVDVIHHEGVAR